MYPYTISQWLLFFFWYCFVGWIWECCYVSATKAVTKKKWQWVNRGFLNGPWLPIYGSAVVVILIATIPVKESPVLIFLFGMFAATALELVTGSVMERLFHVKYWDYSNLPLNFHGYICFFVSVFWGVGSLFIIKVLHVPVECLVMKLPPVVCEIAAFILLSAFVYDFSISLREALDMKEMLEKLTDYKATLQKFEHRLDAVIAFTPIPDIDELREKGKSAKEKIIFLCTNNQILRVTKHLKRNPGAISKKYAEALKEIKELFEDKDDKE